MSRKRSVKNRLTATLVADEDRRLPCVFCKRDVDDEIVYGKLYAIGDIQCHYFCVLLSSCLVQKGKDKEGLLGFMYDDILAEVERSKKHRCSYCGRGGANLGCNISQCRKQFHLPCGRERDAVSLFKGNYKSFCQKHAPKQSIPDSIMAKARLRISAARKSAKCKVNTSDMKESSNEASTSEETESVCVICYETVEGFPTVNTFWPPCCARDAWFHRNCLQRMTISAGMYYLKCPLCNDKNNFYNAVVSQGYYVPDRDAAWELEQDAFAEIYESPTISCSATECLCPLGRQHNADNKTGEWEIKLCLLCGSCGLHLACGNMRYICVTCLPAAPEDYSTLEQNIEKVVISQQPEVDRSTRRRPMMSSRMSLRRIKQRRLENTPSTSINSQVIVKTENVTQEEQSPKKLLRTMLVEELPTLLQGTIDNIQSPLKLLQNVTNNKLMSPMKIFDFVCDKMEDRSEELDKYLEKLRLQFKKPCPLGMKRKNINRILKDLFNDIIEKENLNNMNPVKGLTSPKNQPDIDKLTVNEKNMEPVKELTSPENQTNIVELKVNEENVEPVKELTSPEKQPDIDELTVNEENMEPVKELTSPEKQPDIDKLTVNEKNMEPVKEFTSPVKQPDIGKLTVNEKNMEPVKELTSSKNQTNIVELKVNEENVEPVKELTSPKKQPDIDELKGQTQGYSKEAITTPTQNNTQTNTTVKDEQNINTNTQSQDNVTFKIPEITPKKRNLNKNGENMKIITKQTLETHKDDLTAINHNQKIVLNKFSPIDKETLQRSNIGIDIECFKNRYLNEVDRDFVCKFNHAHRKSRNCNKLLDTPIRFAIDSAMGVRHRDNLKRKLDSKDGPHKKRKVDKSEDETRVISKNKTNQSDSENINNEETKLDDILFTNSGHFKVTDVENYCGLLLKDGLNQSNLVNEITEDKDVVDEEISEKIKENYIKITDTNTDSDKRSKASKGKRIKNNNTINKRDPKSFIRIKKSSLKSRDKKRSKSDVSVKSKEITKRDVNNDKENEKPSKPKIEKNSDKKGYRKKSKIIHEMSKMSRVKDDRRKFKRNCISSEKNFLKFVISNESTSKQSKRNIKIKVKVKVGSKRNNKYTLKNKELKLKTQQSLLSPDDITKLVMPKYDMTPTTRKHVKRERTSDNLKQTSIISFFST